MNLTKHWAAIVTLALAGSAWAAEDDNEPTELSPLEVEAPSLLLPKTRIRPPYPQLARRNWLEGCVLLQYTIREDGLTDDFAILESHPVGVFEAGVIKAVLRWEFQPQRDQPQHRQPRWRERRAHHRELQHRDQENSDLRQRGF